MSEDNKIAIYQTEDGQTQIDVRLEDETVWLTANQMAVLFDRDEKTVRKHINNVFREGELEKNNNTHFLRVDGVKQPVAYYNLDVIISVGYRVKSKRGTAFRIWARQIIKDFLVKGYAVNDRIRHEQIAELRQLVQMVGRTIQSQQLESNNEHQILFDIVVDYTYALDTLDKYDFQQLTVEKTTLEGKFHATYDNAMDAIKALAATDFSETKKTTRSKAASDKSTRHSVAKSSIPAWRRKPPCCSISLQKTTLSAMATNVLPQPFSCGS